MNESISELFKHAMQHKDIGEYKKTQTYLDNIIKLEPENHLAWYEKSKLPIMQEDDVIVRNRVISLSTFQRSSLADKSIYLQQCGFAIGEINELEEYLKIPNLVALQRNKYLKIAIRYAPEHEKIIYETELNMLTVSDEKRKSMDRRTVIVLGLISLPISIAVAFHMILFPYLPVFKKPMQMIMILMIPYVLSVVGITFYEKAKRNGTITVLGFVCNIIALIISNLAIINVIFTFWIK